jgi:hypothetical protein
MVNILVSVGLSESMESNFEMRMPVEWVLLFLLIDRVNMRAIVVRGNFHLQMGSESKWRTCILHIYESLLTGFGLVIGFIDDLCTQLITTSNYNSFTCLRTTKITVTAAHIKSSITSVVVSW